MELSQLQWQPSAWVWPGCVWAISEGAGGESYRLFSTGLALFSLRKASVCDRQSAYEADLYLDETR